MRLLVDTSAYSEAMIGHIGVIAELRSRPALLMNPIILGELRAGFAAGTRQDTNEKRLREFLHSPRVEILPIDEETSTFYAEIRLALRKGGKPVPTNDVWIAASAMQHGCAILSMDRHFEQIPQVIVRRHDRIVP